MALLQVQVVGVASFRLLGLHDWVLGGSPQPTLTIGWLAAASRRYPPAAALRLADALRQ
jgi:hypothetical protein